VVTGLHICIVQPILLPSWLHMALDKKAEKIESKPELVGKATAGEY
jgi:hypothetical protein